MRSPQRTVVSDGRLRYLARQVHRLGERPLYELLREIANGADLAIRLEVYARLPADFIKSYGGDVLPDALGSLPHGETLQ